MVQLNFNPQQYEPKFAGSAPQLPVSDQNGWPCIFIASEAKPMKEAENGSLLEFTAQIIDGPYKGQTGALRLNLWHRTSSQAVQIAHQQLSAICHALGVFQVQDSSVLHGKPLRIIVTEQPKAKPADPTYTQISGIRDINGNEPGKAPPQPQAPQVPQAAVTGFQPQPQQPQGGYAPPQNTGYVPPQQPQPQPGPVYAGPPPNPPQGQWQTPAPQNPNPAAPPPPWNQGR